MENVIQFHSIDRSPWFRFVPFGLLCLFAVSCSPSSPQAPDDVKVIPITGKIRLDGQPGHGVVVIFVQKSGLGTKDPTYYKGRVDEEGKLTVATFADDDGVPSDDYVLSFVKFDTSKIIIGQKPPDLLKGKYADPTTSEHTCTVPADVSSFDIGTIELTTP